MRIKVFRAQVVMGLSALEREAARGPADARFCHAVDDLRSSLAHLDAELAAAPLSQSSCN